MEYNLEAGDHVYPVMTDGSDSLAQESIIGDRFIMMLNRVAIRDPKSRCTKLRDDSICPTQDNDFLVALYHGDTKMTDWYIVTKPR